MGIDLKTVDKIPGVVDKIKVWTGEHKGLILTVVAIIAVIVFFACKQRRKPDLKRDKQGRYLKKGVNPVYPGREIPPEDVE